jgi:two-component system CheB/CheR fusion protein
MARKNAAAPRRSGKARASTPAKAPAPRADAIEPGVNPAAPDHATPETGLPFPIVAVGGSAGGLDAFEKLLQAVPDDTGMAFVMILHLAPDSPSLLSEILARATRMPVRHVEDRSAIEPNHVYVIPPNSRMVLSQGRLRLLPRPAGRTPPRAVDEFMRSLAEEHGHKAIGVVLSGTGNDGTLGLQEVKAAGGITFAQDATAEHSGMPRNAIAGGGVDNVLSPTEIAIEIARLARDGYVSQPDGASRALLPETELHQVLEILRASSGVDFSSYKRNTVNRRIARRMVLQKLPGPREYVELLKKSPAEVEALHQDVLINVTSFFRNPQAYEALKREVFPRITQDRARHDPVRIWALGCSTGEEAYSLAIAFSEYLEETGKRFALQVFATDLNGGGIEKARIGRYSKAIVQDVSPERLRRYFIEVDGSYRVAKGIRDMCVFARQNVLVDPPFSRIDLVACRNLLIYLEPVLQERVIPMLHYALRGQGVLWLGSSETIGSYGDLFEVLDAKHKIYLKKGASSRSRVHLPVYAKQGSPAPESTKWAARPADFDPSREADRMILARYSPPGVVVDGNMDILQFRGDTGPYLRPAPGKASLGLFKMLREGLMVGLRAALARARQEEGSVREEGLRVRSDGGWRPVDVVVAPLKGADGGSSWLVLFEEPAGSLRARAQQIESEAKAAALAPVPDKGGDEEIARLKQELSATRDYLQAVIEQQEAANEELQSANEEIQSANEELQSINEELETSKEEIQSSNEELATVNDELQNRNLELSQSNNDFVNLLASVQMAIVMLGPDLRIRRFTPAAEKLLNLVPGDIGRPVGDLKLGIPVSDLDALLAETVDNIVAHEREVQMRGGGWYSLRVRPYRTLENKIEGAVLMLVDIDEPKRAELAVRESEARFALLANSAPVLIWMTDLVGCRFVNRAFEEFVGAVEADIRSSDPARWVHPDDREAYRSRFSEAMKARAPFEARLRFRRADGEYRWMKAMGNPRYLSSGELLGYVGCTVDVTDMQESEAALIELDRGKNEFLAMLAHELRNPLSGMRNASHLLEQSGEASVLSRARDIIDRQTRYMVRMVDDLLDISRIAHGKVHVEPQPLDLRTTVREAVESTAGDREARRQELSLTLPEEAAWVKADPMRLDQVVRNLLDNAAKFTREGGRIWVDVERPAAPGESVVLRVRDNGMGIDHALLPRIFELFAQGDRRSERSRSGIGLGLALTRRLVELQGGSIEAFSAGNALGSEFVVRLPGLAPEEIPGESRASPALPPQAGSEAVRRILVVDDNRDSAESLALMLELGSHEVRVVLDGGSAEAAAREFRPEVVLLDIGLPDLDGYDVARRLRALPGGREMLIVAVTGYGREEDAASSRAAGIDLHVTKPIEPAALSAIIARPRGRGGSRR